MPGQAQSVAIPKRWPLVTPLQNRYALNFASDISQLKDARLVNCYAELDPVTQEYYVEKRPGLSAPIFNTPGGGRGVYNWQGTIYSVSGNNLYKNGALFSALAFTGLVTFTEIKSVPPLLFFDDGVNTAHFTDGTTVTAIVDPNFPVSRVRGAVYLDGTLYVMTNAGPQTAAIFGSKNFDDPSTWDPLNKIIAQIEPDSGVAIYKHLLYTIAYKQWTTEVFYDAGNTTGSPLGPVQAALIPFGCVHSGGIQDIDGMLIWPTSNKQVSPQVMMLNQLQAQMISTPPVERLLSTMNATSTVRSFAIKVAGHRFYGLTYENMNLTLVYDLDQNLWYLWGDSAGNYYPAIGQSYDFTGDRLIQLESGVIHEIDADYIFPTDNGSIITTDIYTSNINLGTRRRKSLNEMYFNFDRVPGSTLQVRCSNDDYQSWTNFRSVDLGKQKPRLTNCGTFDRRAYHFRHACSYPLRGTAVDLALDIGTL